MAKYRAKQVPEHVYEVFQWSQRLTGPNAEFVKRCTGGQYGKPLVAVPDNMEVFGMTAPGVWINGSMVQ